jgi:hypothetical protein
VGVWVAVWVSVSVGEFIGVSEGLGVTVKVAVEGKSPGVSVGLNLISFLMAEMIPTLKSARASMIGKKKRAAMTNRRIDLDNLKAP